jgi:hypothetical protein
MIVKAFSLGLVMLLAGPALRAQPASICVPGNIRMPHDSLMARQLLRSLNGFLAQADGPAKENSYVQQQQLLETSLLLDEMKELAKSNYYKSDSFFKPYLQNVVQLDDSNFIIQLSWMGIDGQRPALRASFTLLADKKGDSFYFYSPLRQNTESWKSTRIGNTTIHYKHSINTAKANAYFKMIAAYDKKLMAPGRPADFYCADNFTEVLQLIGIDYKADFNAYRHTSELGMQNNRSIDVNGSLGPGFSNFDPHDLWHARLHMVLSPDSINRPVDEGAAYLYGGSWGFSWQQILARFKAYAAQNPHADWHALYNASTNFDPGGEYPLNVDFAINALLIQKIDKEKGFRPVLELLACGKKEEGNKNYFAALYKVAGISEAGFNAAVAALIK